MINRSPHFTLLARGLVMTLGKKNQRAPKGEGPEPAGSSRRSRHQIHLPVEN